MSKTIIKCTNANGTYLKITNEQSTHDSNELKVFVPVDTELELTDISSLDNKNHYRISLAEPENGQYDWVAYHFHWAIVSTDDKDIKANDPPRTVKQFVEVMAPVVSKYAPFVQKQINSLTKSAKGNFINLNVGVKYESQLDNYQMRYRSCNSSAHAMYLNWLLLATGQNKYVTDDTYLKQVLQIADTTVHWAHTSLLKKYGFNSEWDTDADVDAIISTLEAGIPVTCNINHHPVDWVNQQVYGGHIIVLIGYNAQTKMFTTHDPFGDVNTGYKNRNGAYNKMSKAQFRVRTQGGARFLV
jgi:putative lipoic acid-binding regulatory protein